LGFNTEEKMKKWLLVTSLLATGSLLASPNIPLEQQIASFTVEETPIALVNPRDFNSSLYRSDDPTEPEKPKPITFEQKVERTGAVIKLGRDMVALGEAVYELVKKGKPSNVTQYSAISVVPRNPTTKEVIDPFDLEGFSMPVEKNFTAKVMNGAGKEVVNFTYKVLYSFGGSYNGIGKYLTNVMIVPGSIRTLFGWDFSASMTLNGIMNHGSKDAPVAGAMLSLKYQMNSWSAAFERNDTIHVTGNGELKNHNM